MLRGTAASLWLPKAGTGLLAAIFEQAMLRMFLLVEEPTRGIFFYNNISKRGLRCPLSEVLPLKLLPHIEVCQGILKGIDYIGGYCRACYEGYQEVRQGLKVSLHLPAGWAVSL